MKVLIALCLLVVNVSLALRVSKQKSNSGLSDQTLVSNSLLNTSANGTATTLKNTMTVTCNADETLCKENNNCISKNLVCDFNFDCNRVGSTSSDEENCTYPVCKEGEELTFANKRCIPGGKANSSHSSPNGEIERPEATSDGKAGVIFWTLGGSLLIALGIIAAIFYNAKRKRDQPESGKSLILYNVEHDQVNSA